MSQIKRTDFRTISVPVPSNDWQHTRHLGDWLVKAGSEGLVLRSATVTEDGWLVLEAATATR